MDGVVSTDITYPIRLSCKALIIDAERRVLLVEHRHVERGDTFWDFPGGGVQGAETLVECLKREVREEVGLEIEPDRPAYVMQRIDHAAEVHHVSFYFSVLSFDGNPSINDPRAGEGYYLRQCAFLSQSDLETADARPRALIDRYWDDLKHGLECATILQPNAEYLKERGSRSRD